MNSIADSALTARLRSRRAVIVLGFAFVALALGASASLGGPERGCSEVAPGDIFESTNYTPASQQRRPPGGPINPTGAQSGPALVRGTLPTTIDGLPLQWFSHSAAGTFAYYWDLPIEPTTTVDTFGGSRGVEFQVVPRDGGSSFASMLLAEFGDRATPVEVGPFDGALTWHDPDVNGLRRHGLYWSDGQVHYSLIADRPAEEIVNLGRHFACAP
jgi:hypothetical protein